MASNFREIIEFFARIGIYDVVLPFLLVFTIVFAILEKTRVFGVERTKDGEFTKKNLNSMAAFVIAFLVIASSRLVAIINQTMANMVLLLILSVCFLILIGSFMQDKKEGVFLEGAYKHIFMAIMFIGIILIFLNSLGWLDTIMDYLINHYDSTLVGSIILMGIIIGFMYFVTREYKPAKA
jgi:hypothetical protein